MDLGCGIRDPESGKNLFWVPDPGVKNAPNPGSGSATLFSMIGKQDSWSGFILKTKSVVFTLLTVYLIVLGQLCGHEQGRYSHVLSTLICIISPTVNENFTFISMVSTFMFSVLCNLHIPGMPLVGVPHGRYFSVFYFLQPAYICPILCNLHTVYVVS